MLGAAAFGALVDRVGDLRQASLRLTVYQPLVDRAAALGAGPGRSWSAGDPGGQLAAPMTPCAAASPSWRCRPAPAPKTFTWLLLAVMVGASASSAIAGPLIETGGWRSG